MSEGRKGHRTASGYGGLEPASGSEGETGLCPSEAAGMGSEEEEGWLLEAEDKLARKQGFNRFN